MITVEQVVKWCDEQGMLVHVYHNSLAAGGTVSEENTSGYRVEWDKEDVKTVWYPEFDLKFDPKTREITDFGLGPYDIRKHPKWSL